MREIYVDESSHTGHAFMVLGALIVPGPNRDRLEAELERVTSAHGTIGEFKWTKVSRSKLPVYREFIQAYFRLYRDLGCEFHALIVDCAKLDHGRYNDGDAELGFNKFLFLLLHHRAGKRFGESERLVAYLDARTTARHPEELQTILNRSAARHFGEIARPPFAKVVFRDSRTSRLIQLVDLLAGAIAWHKNDRDTNDCASVHKSDLAQVIAGAISRPRLGGDTRDQQLSQWNLALRPQRRGAR